MIALQYISALIVKHLYENQMHYESKDAKSMHTSVHIQGKTGTVYMCLPQICVLLISYLVFLANEWR